MREGKFDDLFVYGTWEKSEKYLDHVYAKLRLNTTPLDAFQVS